VELSLKERLYRAWYIGSGATIFEIWSRGASPAFCQKFADYLKIFWQQANEAIDRGDIQNGRDLASAMLYFFDNSWKTFYDEMKAQGKPDLTPRIFQQTVHDTMLGWGFWSTYLDALDEQQLQWWPAVKNMLQIYLDFASNWIPPSDEFPQPKGVDWYFNQARPIEEKEQVVYGQYYMPWREGTYRALWLATGAFLAWLDQNMTKNQPWIDPSTLRTAFLPAFAKYLYDNVSQSLERLDSPDEATEFIITKLKDSGFNQYFGEDDVKAHFLYEGFWKATAEFNYLDPDNIRAWLGQDVDPHQLVDNAIQAMKLYGKCWPVPANLVWRPSEETPSTQPIVPESPEIKAPPIAPPPSTEIGQEQPTTSMEQKQPPSGQAEQPPITVIGQEQGTPAERGSDIILHSPFTIDWDSWRRYFKKPSAVSLIDLPLDFNALKIYLQGVSFSVWNMGLVDRKKYPTPEDLNSALCQAWLQVSGNTVTEAILLWDDSRWFQVWNLVMGRA